MTKVEFYKYEPQKHASIILLIYKKKRYMQLNIDGANQTVYWHQDDVVFALQPNRQLPWPARIVRVCSESTYAIRFYMLQNEEMVNRDQLWPFDQVNIQTFAPEHSTPLYRRAVGAATKYSGRKLAKIKQLEELQLDYRELLNKSFATEPIYFQTHSQSLSILMSRKAGLSIIPEADSSLETSSHSNFPQAQVTVKTVTKRRKNEVQLLSLSSQQLASNMRITRSQKRRMFDAELKEKIKEKKMMLSHLLNEIIQQDTQRSSSQQGIQSEIRSLFFVRSSQEVEPENDDNSLPEQTEDSGQNKENQEPHFQQQEPQVQQHQQQNNFDQREEIQQNLVVFGPPNIDDLSTQASLNSIHTALDLNQSRTSRGSTYMSFHQRPQIPEYYLRVQSQGDRSREIGEELNEQDVYAQLYSLFLKLCEILANNGPALTISEQLNLSRNMDYLNEIKLGRQVLLLMIKFLQLFQRSEEQVKNLCYREYLMIQQRMNVIMSLYSENRLINIDEDVPVILQAYQRQREANQ